MAIFTMMGAAWQERAFAAAVGPPMGQRSMQSAAAQATKMRPELEYIYCSLAYGAAVRSTTVVLIRILSYQYRMVTTLFTKLGFILS
jgi:hypothetical protein